MNFYVGVINEAVDYIEDNIGEKLSLVEVAARFAISHFHFNRMFKTVSGVTLKQYILGRKLSKAMEQLKSTNRPIIDIALDLGFEYPEVFSRAFKKQFGVSPAYFRESSPLVEVVPRACIVERDIINYQGTLALKGKCLLLDELTLRGIAVTTNTNADDFQQSLKEKTEGFLVKAVENAGLEHDKFYTAVSCSGNDDGEYTVFCGKKPIAGMVAGDAQTWVIPGGWYVSFDYHGDMFDIREAFVDDLYKWIMVKEAELNPNGIGMLNIYSNNYPENNAVKILVPVKKPV